MIIDQLMSAGDQLVSAQHDHDITMISPASLVERLKRIHNDGL